MNSVCDTSALYPRELGANLGEFGCVSGLLVHGAVLIPHAALLCTVLNGKSMALLTFSEQTVLFKAAWCPLEKNVLSLLPLGLPQEFSISKSHLPSHGTPPLKTQTRRGGGSQ